MAFLQIITPFLFASYGGLYTELSGATNVSIEGYISLGGFIFISITKLTGSVVLGFICTILISGLLSLSQALLTIRLKANQIITGLAVNMGFGGLISALSYNLFNTKGVIPLDKISQINTFPLSLLSLILPIITIIVIKKTRFGLRLQARGFNKKSLIYSKLNSNYYRIVPMIISGILSSIAGVFLSMELRAFTPNLAGGRGWISLIIIFLGRKTSPGIFISTLIFSGTLMISNSGQESLLPSEIILAIPYILTLIALIISRSVLFNSPGKFIGNNKERRQEK